jgi:hypothetical protein
VIGDSIAASKVRIIPELTLAVFDSYGYPLLTVTDAIQVMPTRGALCKLALAEWGRLYRLGWFEQEVGTIVLLGE